MNELEYLKAHHAVTEQAIGTAILELKDKNYGRALAYLKDSVERLDNLDEIKRIDKANALLTG